MIITCNTGRRWIFFVPAERLIIYKEEKPESVFLFECLSVLCRGRNERCVFITFTLEARTVGVWGEICPLYFCH